MGEVRYQNLYICSKWLLILKFVPSLWSISSRIVWLVVDLLLFWQNVDIFSDKCPRTRFARFAFSFMSAQLIPSNVWLAMSLGHFTQHSLCAYFTLAATFASMIYFDILVFVYGEVHSSFISTLHLVCWVLLHEFQSQKIH